MHNSYVVTIFHRSYSKLKVYYNESYLKKLEDKLIKSLNMIAKSSAVVKSMSSEAKSENMKIYKLYVKIVEKTDNIFEFFRNRIKSYSKSSHTCNQINKLFNGKKAIIATTAMFALSFSLSLIIMKTINKNMNLDTIIILLVLFILSTSLLFNSRKISTAIGNSFFISFIRDILTIDDEEDIPWK